MTMRTRHGGTTKISGRGAVFPLALLASWELAAALEPDSFIFVSFAKVGRTLLEVVFSGELPMSLLASLRKALLALLLGVVSGLAISSLLAASKLADKVVGPTLHAFRQVPVLGLAPLLGLWFGQGEFGKVLLVFLAVFYPVVLNSYAGLKSVDMRLLEVARIYGLGRWKTFQQLYFPSLLPFLLTGISHAIAYAWIATVGSEMLLTAGAGIGNMMLRAQAGGRMDVVLVCVLSVLVMSVLLDRGMRHVGLKKTRWQDTVEGHS
jgi:sulfonate transport system permease protein